MVCVLVTVAVNGSATTILTTFKSVVLTMLSDFAIASLIE